MPDAANILNFPLLTIVLFLPAAAATACALVLEDEGYVRIVAIAAAVLDLALSVALLVRFQITTGAGTASWVFQFADHRDWISSLGISYWLGVDGVSVFLVVLTCLMMSIAIIAGSFMIADRVRLFMIFMLFLETAILGNFMAVNLFLFFIFWEAMLIPSYFLLGMWGEERRVYATMKFLVYTIFGSFFMLVGLFYLWSRTGTLDMAGPKGLIALLSTHPLSPVEQAWLFLAFGIAFAIKLPLFPFHTWAPTAYTEAPIPVAIAVAGILSKAGAFGFIRYDLTLFPHAARQFAGLISVLAIIGMLYAAVLALTQTDIKRLVAYASVSHMNIIVIGIFALNATGLDGSVLQMINHSVIISGLFLCVGYIAARTGTRDLRNMGGLGVAWPGLMWLFFILILAGLDLPGLGSFTGEFLIFIGVFQSNAWFAAIAALTAIIAAWYMIRFFQDTMNGPVTASPEQVAEVSEDPTRTVYQFPVAGRLLQRDLLGREALLLAPLLAIVIYIGIQPDPLTARINPTTGPQATLVHQAPAPSAIGGQTP